MAGELWEVARSEWMTDRLQGLLPRCDEAGIEILALDTPDYPAMLAAIFDAPPVLYVRGRSLSDLPLQRSVAIVGTRKASNQGLAFSYRLAAELSSAGAVIVSGLAIGIDAEAHRAVVEGEGVGIGVLAGGLDGVHPPVNRQLALALCERGCLVSEHPPGSSPQRAFFVGRNRLISGLSRAVAVIEAGKGSGALTTAEFANEQGRTLFVMPGRPGDPRVAGSLPLLLDGATPLLSSAEVAAELGLGVQEREEEPIVELGDDGSLFTAGATFDAIAAVSGLPAPSLLARLSRLEMAGLVRRGTDGRYYRN